MADLIDKSAAVQAVFDWEQGKISGTIADAIAALPAQGVRLKPLVWGGPSGDPEPWENYGWEQYAASVAGTYRAFNRNGLWRAVIHRVDNAHFIAEAETLDAAKAAAQADYERRILAALAPASGGVEGHPYSLRPDLRRIVENAKTAPQWDTERDRLAPAPVDALVKAADGLLVVRAALDSWRRVARDGRRIDPSVVGLSEMIDALDAGISLLRGEK